MSCQLMKIVSVYVAAGCVVRMCELTYKKVKKGFMVEGDRVIIIVWNDENRLEWLEHCAIFTATRFLNLGLFEKVG